VIPAHQRLLLAARSAGAAVVYLRAGALSSSCADALPAFQSTFREYEAYDGGWG